MKSLLCLLIVVSLVNANIFYELSKEDYNKVRNSRNFTGKVVLVTGSNAGIGEGIVSLFSALGAHIIITGRNGTTVKKAAQKVQELSPNKLKPLEVVGDVTKSEDLNKLINETIKTFGKLDILVNNAGTDSNDSITDTNFMKNYDQVFNTDLRSVTELNHLAVPYLIKTKGTIIHISSISGIAPMEHFMAYSMAKSAMIIMTKCLALELGPLGVRVNTISPGATDSQHILESKNETLIKELEPYVKITPLRRVGQVLDIAKGVAFLASSDSSFITGANLVIDGGLVYTLSPFDNKK